MNRAHKLIAAGPILFIALLLCSCGKQPDAPQPAPAAKSEQSADDILRETAQAITKLTRLQTNIEFERVRNLTGQDSLTTGVFTLAFDKGDAERRTRYRYELTLPNAGEWPVKLAIFADGETRSFYNSQFEEYYSDPQEGDLGELVPDFEKRIMLEPYYFLAPSLLLNPDPLSFIKLDAEEILLVTRAADRKQNLQRIWLKQASADVLLAIDTRTHLPSSITIDFLKQTDWSRENSAANPGQARSSLTFMFRYEKIGQFMLPATFQFAKPAAAVEVNSPQRIERNQNIPGALSEDVRMLLGTQAYPFRLKDFANREFGLSDFSDKTVLLFFFDSQQSGWRPELRDIARAVAQFQPKLFQPIAIDLARQPAQQLIKSAEADLPDWIVLRDAEQELRYQYTLQGRTQAVLIDRRQRLAYIHYPPFEKSGTLLKKQIGLLNLYQDLDVEQAGFAESDGADQLEVKWKLELGGLIDFDTGLLDRISSNPLVLYSTPGELHYYDPEQRTSGSIFSSNYTAKFRLCPAAGPDGEERWLSWYRNKDESRLGWLDEKGRKIWDYHADQSVMDALPAALGAAGKFEILIGFNAGSGVHCVNPDGAMLWKREDLVNIWSVGVLDANHDGIAEIVIPGRLGNVLLLDAQGNDLKTITPGVLTTHIRTAADFGKYKNVIACGGAAKKNEMVVLMSADNEIYWSYSFGIDQRDETTGMAFGKWNSFSFLALTSQLGNVQVLNEKGEPLYSARARKPFAGLVTADFDQDGLDEIVLWNADGLVCLGPNRAMIRSLGLSLE